MMPPSQKMSPRRSSRRIVRDIEAASTLRPRSEAWSYKRSLSWRAVIEPSRSNNRRTSCIWLESNGSLVFMVPFTPSVEPDRQREVWSLARRDAEPAALLMRNEKEHVEQQLSFLLLFSYIHITGYAIFSERADRKQKSCTANRC